MTKPVQDVVLCRTARKLKSPPKLVGASSLLQGVDAARLYPGGLSHGTCRESVQSTVATFSSNRIRGARAETQSRAGRKRIHVLDTVCGHAVLSVVAFGLPT